MVLAKAAALCYHYLGASNNGSPYPLCDEFVPFAKTERGKGSRKDIFGVRIESQEMQSD